MKGRWVLAQGTPVRQHLNRLTFFKRRQGINNNESGPETIRRIIIDIFSRCEYPVCVNPTRATVGATVSMEKAFAVGDDVIIYSIHLFEAVCASLISAGIGHDRNQGMIAVGQAELRNVYSRNFFWTRLENRDAIKTYLNIDLLASSRSNVEYQGKLPATLEIRFCITKIPKQSNRPKLDAVI